MLGADAPSGGDRRCAGTKNDGTRCRSRAMADSDTCLFHAENHVEFHRRGGQVSAARRSVRERLREDAERIYDSLFRSLEEAIESEVVKWGDCPECGHKVPVTFSDIRARTQAIQVLLDQGYGRPAESVRVNVDAASSNEFERMTLEEQDAAIAAVRAKRAALRAVKQDVA